MIYLVSERCVDSAVNNAYGLFYQRFVLRLSAPCRKNNTAVMVGKVQEVSVDYWFILIGFGDCTFKVVRDKGFGNTTEVM